MEVTKKQKIITEHVYKYKKALVSKFQTDRLFKEKAERVAKLITPCNLSPAELVEVLDMAQVILLDAI